MQDHAYVTETIFQKKLERRHGYKRVFTWNKNGTLRCTDIADGLDVDFVFESNKDRALWFNMGSARHLAGGASWKSDAMMGTCGKIEGATSGADAARRMREIAESPQVHLHTGTVSEWFGMATRSSKVLGEVAKMLEKNLPELLPMPQWEDRKLGLWRAFHPHGCRPAGGRPRAAKRALLFPGPRPDDAARLPSIASRRLALAAFVHRLHRGIYLYEIRASKRRRHENARSGCWVHPSRLMP